MTIGAIGLDPESTPVPVTLADPIELSSSTSIEIASMGDSISASKVRAATVTPYTARDVVSESGTAGTVWTFAGAASEDGGSGMITMGSLFSDQKAEVWRGRLWLFHTVPTQWELDDNLPSGFKYASVGKLIGKIDFDALETGDSTASSGAFSFNPDVRLPFKCAEGDSAIYGVLVTLDAFTPVASSNLRIHLFVEQGG